MAGIVHLLASQAVSALQERVGSGYAVADHRPPKKKVEKLLIGLQEVPDDFHGGTEVSMGMMLPP